MPITDGYLARLALPPLPPALAIGEGGLLDTSPGAPDGSSSDADVLYATGAAQYSETDLSSDGFGMPWGQTRTWTSGPGYASHGLNGNGWVDTQLPYLLSDGGTNTLIAIVGGTDARYFDLSGGSYVERFFGLDTLTHDTTNHLYVLTDPDGNQLTFYDFTSNWSILQRGGFDKYTDAYGNVTQATWTSGALTEVQQSGGGASLTYLYTYVSSGVNKGLLSNVTLENGGAVVRQVLYAYYDGTDSNGNIGDLKTAIVEDASNNVLDESYYRYYVPGASNGYAHGLMFAFSPQSYERLAAAYSNPLTATDTQVAPYADDAYQYDTSQRVTAVTVAGAGASSGGGLGTYNYSYSTSSNSAGYNSWQTKTSEGLPDGTTNTVFTNYAGEVMLDSVTTDSETWNTFTEFDTSGRDILDAMPSAVTGYSQSYADLLHKVSGNCQFLSDSSGLIELTDYASTTTATTSSAGNAAGHEEDTKVQQGETGTAILTGSEQYIERSGDEGTIFAVASTTD